MTAATMVSPAVRTVTKSYRVRRAVARDALADQVARVWRGFDRNDPLASLLDISGNVATWTIAGQQVAANDAVTYLARIVAARHGVRLSDVTPFPVPARLIGSSHAGVSVQSLAARSSMIYAKRLDVFDDEDRAAESVRAYLSYIAASEPLRVANLTVMHNAVSDPRMTGRFVRVTSGDACDFCRLIAERGYTEAAAGFVAHRNCGCTPEPEPSFSAYVHGAE